MNKISKQTIAIGDSYNDLAMLKEGEIWNSFLNLQKK